MTNESEAPSVQAPTSREAPSTKHKSPLCSVRLLAGSSCLIGFRVEDYFFGFQKPLNFPANQQKGDRPPTGLKLQDAGYQFLARTFCVFWVGGCSHSLKMKINGKNLHS